MIRTFLLLFSLLIFSCQSDSGYESPAPFANPERTIVLMHPTVLNLERFMFLTSQGLFTLPGNYQVVGVYHKAAAYDYSLSHKFLREKQPGNIALVGLEPVLDPADLFAENALSADFRKIFEHSQGVIFFGGPDIPPAIYGAETSLLTVITDPQRHHLELSFLFHLLGGYQDEAFAPFLEENPEYRILGICLGMQTMNVATGGTMYQDIPTELYNVHTVEGVLAQPADEQHRNYYIHYKTEPEVFPYSFHRIRLKEGSIMAQVAGDVSLMPVIASSHHQALQKIGKGWDVTAWSADGRIAEAIEHKHYPNVLGIQFHPEIIPLYNGEVLHMYPGQTQGKTFLEAFPGEEGEDFHRSFWRFMGEVFR